MAILDQMDSHSATPQPTLTTNFLDFLPPGTPYYTPTDSQTPASTGPPARTTHARFYEPLILDEKENDGIRIHMYLLFYEEHTLLWSMLEQAFVELDEKRLNRAIAWLEEVDAIEIEPVAAPNPWSPEDALVRLIPHPASGSTSPVTLAGSQLHATTTRDPDVDPQLPLPWPGSHIFSPMHPATPGPPAGLALLPVMVSEKEYEAETNALPSEATSHVSKTPKHHHHRSQYTPGPGGHGATRPRISKSALDLTSISELGTHAAHKAPLPFAALASESSNFLRLSANDTNSSQSPPPVRPPITSNKSVTILDDGHRSTTRQPKYDAQPPSSSSHQPPLHHSFSSPAISKRFDDMRFIPLLGGSGITTSQETLGPLATNYSFLDDLKRAQVTPPSSDRWVSETPTPSFDPVEDDDGMVDEEGWELDLKSAAMGTRPIVSRQNSNGDMLDNLQYAHHRPPSTASFSKAPSIASESHSATSAVAPVSTTNDPKDNKPYSKSLDDEPTWAGGAPIETKEVLEETLLYARSSPIDWRHGVAYQTATMREDRPVGVLLQSQGGKDSKTPKAKEHRI